MNVTPGQSSTGSCGRRAAACFGQVPFSIEDFERVRSGVIAAAEFDLPSDPEVEDFDDDDEDDDDSDRLQRGWEVEWR
jgi:hypothetical protein